MKIINFSFLNESQMAYDRSFNNLYHTLELNYLLANVSTAIGISG